MDMEIRCSEEVNVTWWHVPIAPTGGEMPLHSMNYFCLSESRNL